MVAFDICGFSSSADPHLMRLMRRSMYQVVQEAAEIAQMPWSSCYYEDRGDGFFLLAPPGYSVHSLVDPLASLVRTGLAEVNNALPVGPQLRLRMAVHHGELIRDEHGVISPDLNTLFRLLNAPVLKARFEQGDLALIVSDEVYQRVIRWGVGLIDQKRFQPLIVEKKSLLDDIRTPPCGDPPKPFDMAWAMLPPQPVEAPSATLSVPDPETLARLERLEGVIHGLLSQGGRRLEDTIRGAETEKFST
jgi:hypothetical protein